MQTEFANLDDESKIYKLVGPVLLKQDKSEATMAVNGRLDFIKKEMSVLMAPMIKPMEETCANTGPTVSELKVKFMRHRRRAMSSAPR